MEYTTADAAESKCCAWNGILIQLGVQGASPGLFRPDSQPPLMPRPPRPQRVATQASRGGRVDQEGEAAAELR